MYQSKSHTWLSLFLLIWLNLSQLNNNVFVFFPLWCLQWRSRMEQLPWRCSLWRVLKAERPTSERGRKCQLLRKRSLCCKGSWPNSLSRLEKQVQQIAHRCIYHSFRQKISDNKALKHYPVHQISMLYWGGLLCSCLKE